MYEQAIEEYSLGIKKAYLNREFLKPFLFTNLALAYKANKKYEMAIYEIDEMSFIFEKNFSQLEIDRKETNDFLPQQSKENLEGIEIKFIYKAKMIKISCLILLVKQFCLENEHQKTKAYEMLKHLYNIEILLEEIKEENNQVFYIQSKNNNDLLIKYLKNEILSKLPSKKLVSYLKARQKKISQHSELTRNKLLEEKHKAVLSFWKDDSCIFKYLENHCEERDLYSECSMDPISFMEFKNPVILPSGISYEEESILKHFNANNYADPITKEKFNFGVSIIVKNLTLQQLIREKRRIQKDDIECITG